MIHLLQQNGLPRRSRKAVKSHLMVVFFLWEKDRNTKRYSAPKNITIEYEVDLIDQIWEDRPTLSKKPCFFLEDKYTGENVASKLKRVRGKNG
mgnify:CR=1 FL=1